MSLNLFLSGFIIYYASSSSGTQEMFGNQLAEAKIKVLTLFYETWNVLSEVKRLLPIMIATFKATGNLLLIIMAFPSFLYLCTIHFSLTPSNDYKDSHFFDTRVPP